VFRGKRAKEGVGQCRVYDFWRWREPINQKDNEYKLNPANQIIPVTKINCHFLIIPPLDLPLNRSLFSDEIYKIYSVNTHGHVEQHLPSLGVPVKFYRLR